MNGWEREGDGYLLAARGGVLTLTLNAPEARNPFRQSMSSDFAAIFAEARRDSAIRCLVVRGSGDHLSSGGDIAGFKLALQKPRSDLQAHFHERLERAAVMVENLLAFDRPVLVRMRGAVAGAGMLFPLAADLVIADETATFLFAYNRLGLTPDGGISHLLPRAVGERQARRLLLTAATVRAEESLRLGLVDRIVPADELDVELDEAAAQLAGASQGAVSRTKRLLLQSMSVPLGEQLAAERDGIVASVGHDDFAEAVDAFLEKRRPQFA